jgi:citrate synthase
MDALRMAAGTAGLGTNEDVPAEDEARPEALSLVARFSTIVAAYWRLLGGEEPCSTRPRVGTPRPTTCICSLVKFQGRSSFALSRRT